MRTELLFLALFTVYSFVVFWYSAHLFTGGVRDARVYWLPQAVNAGILAAAVLLRPPVCEACLMLLYFAACALELKLLFRDNWPKTLFVTACYATPFFSLRLLFLTAASWRGGIPLVQIMHSPGDSIRAAIPVLLTLIPCFLVLRFHIPYASMNLILSSRRNLGFCTSVLLCICVYLLFNTWNLYTAEAYSLLNLYQFKVALCALLGFGAAILYAYLFARLQSYELESDTMETELEEERAQISLLEEVVIRDSFTGCYSRDYAEQSVERMLEAGTLLSVVFVDLDGLKYVNDTCGHSEGDWYIRAAVGILRAAFPRAGLARMGGDEFLVFAEGMNGYDAMQAATRAFRRAERLGREAHKPYPTSISYGVAEAVPGARSTAAALIALADDRMYSFKRSRHRTRGTRQPR